MSHQGITKEDLILVTGATGKQGGAVARKLLDAGWHVRTLTRKRERAADLAARGAEIFEGDLNSRESVSQALEGVKGVFSVQLFAGNGVENEIMQGRMLADIASGKGVRHFIYSSVGSADRGTGIPHFESKWQIEQHIRSIGIPYTILRPVFFMQNFMSPDLRKSIEGGTLAMPLRADKPMQMIDIGQIGDFAEMAFDKGLIGEAIDLATDELTMPQAAEIFGGALGRNVAYMELTIDLVEKIMGKEMAVMFDWFNRVGYSIDIPGLKARYGIHLNDFKTFVENVWAPQKVGV